MSFTCCYDIGTTVPQVQWGEEYNGGEDFLELLEIFLEELDTQISDVARRERIKVLALLTHLEGKARQFWITLKADKKTTYNAAARALKQRFRTQFDEDYWFPEVIKAEEKSRAPVLQNQLPAQNKFGSSYRQQAQSATYQTRYTQTKAYTIEYLSNEDLGLVSEINPAEMPTMAAKLVKSVEKKISYIEHLSNKDLGRVSETGPPRMITTPHTETVAYIEHLSDEGLEIVTEINPAEMVTMAAKLVESAEKEKT